MVASLTNASFTAANATGTLVIDRGFATLSLGALEATYDGTPKPVSLTTTPTGLIGVTVTYNGSPTPPTDAGSYRRREVDKRFL